MKSKDLVKEGAKALWLAFPAFAFGSAVASFALMISGISIEKSPLMAALFFMFFAMVFSVGVSAGVRAFSRLPSSEAVPTTDPPGLAEWLVALIVPRADAMLGDLEERFQRNVVSRGLQRARALYWAEALRSIGPVLWMRAKQFGVLALIAEIWRRSRM
jgi:hypothetical protein